MAFVKRTFGTFSFGIYHCAAKTQRLQLYCRAMSNIALHDGNTIFALSSGVGKCGISVIRISGDKASIAFQQVAGPLPKPRSSVLRRLVHPLRNTEIDHAIVLWFPKPKSFTGEDSCEFHVHGSHAVVKETFSALGSIKGCRPATAGEFTKRAFLNDKIGLTEVEGLSDVINADTQLQLQQALLQLHGSLANQCNTWRHRILTHTAHLEALLDFGEEENLDSDESIIGAMQHDIKMLVNEMDDFLCSCKKGERLRSGVRVAIAGKTNAGKSALFNFLADSPAAIVSEIPGTTRDVLEKNLDIDGCPLILFDTAGIRKSSNPIEREGISRALQATKNADFILLVVDATAIDSKQNSIDEIIKDLSLQKGKNNFMIIYNKIDLLSKTSQLTLDNSLDSNSAIMSCLTGEGCPDMLTKLSKSLHQLCGDPGSGQPSFTQERHRRHLSHCCAVLAEFLKQTDAVIAAECLREALYHIAQLSGHVSSDNVLDVIFKDFCIGK